MLKARLLTWALVIVLLAAAMIQAGTYSYETNHAATSPAPSGTMAFATLIQRMNRKVSLAEDFPKSEGFYIIPFAERYREDLVESVRKHKANSTFVLYEIEDYQSGTQVSAEVNNYQADKRVGTIAGSRRPSTEDFQEWRQSFLPEAHSVSVYTLPGYSDYTLLSLDQEGGKRAFYFQLADGILNRHLAKGDNAAIYSGVLKVANPDQKPATFVTGYLDGGGKAGIVEKLGAGFHAGWNQFLVLVAVVFFTLNIRFGRPQGARPPQRSGRELVDGVANLARKKRLGRWALQATFDSTLSELERRRHTSRVQILNRPEDFLTDEQVWALDAAKAGLDIDLDENDALNRARALRKLV